MGESDRKAAKRAARLAAMPPRRAWRRMTPEERLLSTAEAEPEAFALAPPEPAVPRNPLGPEDTTRQTPKCKPSAMPWSRTLPSLSSLAMWVAE
jgi:hypothetical protein